MQAFLNIRNLIILMPMIEDKELRIGLKKGSQLCFTHIYGLYAHKAFLLSFKYLRNKELAEDAVQNAFIKLWNIRETIDDTRPINHLLFHILRNDLLNTLRKLKHRAIFVEQCFETLPLADENNEEWYNEACQQRFQGAIEQLSPRRKEIFQLKLSGKFSNDEIARKLHLSVNTVKFQYSQSLRQIKAIIGDFMLLIIAVDTLSLLSLALF